ncbi:MAG TPA: hypothetical protein PLO63_01920 [Syntrophales bacterium]|nr:hypothetical protein [Syntrophales bacterium]
MDAYGSIMDVRSAINICHKDKFERAGHRLEDYSFHAKKGYGKFWGHLFDSLIGKDPDDDPAAWKWSNKMTKMFVDEWNKKCGCRK